MNSVNMKGFPYTSSKNDALNLFMSKIKFTAPSEKVSLQEALQRVLAVNITAEVDAPSFNRSAMDGYALRAEDTRGASINSPIRIKIISRVDAGQSPNIKLGPYQGVEIMTGARVPQEADSVIMVEYTKRIDDETVEIYQELSPGLNIDRAGSDIAKNETILTAGTILKPADLGVLKALNISQIEVYKRPKIGLFSTGDELVEAADILPPEGKIIENNQLILSSYILEEGGEPLRFGIVPDNYELIKETIIKTMEKCDMLFVTGGTSVGKKDLVPKAVQHTGSLITHGVSMKPGKPTGLAIVKNKPVILMPGYSVACIMAFHVFGKPLIHRFLRIHPPKYDKYILAHLTKRAPSTAGRTDFLRVLVTKKRNEFYATPLRSSGSGILSSMVKANGILEIPDEIEGYEEGDTAPILLYRDQIPEELKDV